MHSLGLKKGFVKRILITEIGNTTLVNQKGGFLVFDILLPYSCCMRQKVSPEQRLPGQGRPRHGPGWDPPDRTPAGAGSGLSSVHPHLPPSLFSWGSYFSVRTSPSCSLEKSRIIHHIVLSSLITLLFIIPLYSYHAFGIQREHCVFPISEIK